jgi:uncharacterized protein (TIGR03437 family)
VDRRSRSAGAVYVRRGKSTLSFRRLCRRGVAALVVERRDERVLQTAVDIAPTAPALLTTWNPSLQHANARNEDGSLNSEENPAAAGSRVSVFATGVGSFQPARPDGAFDGPSAMPAARVEIEQQGNSEVPMAFEAVPGAVQGVVMVSFAAAQPPASVQRPARIAYALLPTASPRRMCICGSDKTQSMLNMGATHAEDAKRV